MLLTITTTDRPATDLGYLLHKHPERVHDFELPYGSAHVFYPEASDRRCTAALLLDVDPLQIARRGFGPAEAAPLGAYVNDRPYVASSYLSVALGKVFSTALSGRSRERPELVERALPLEATVAVVPAPDETVPHRLFEPLGYEVETVRLEGEAVGGSTGASPYVSLRLSGMRRVAELLTHLYVLLPVLDDAKHYYIGDDEVEKLLERGGEWLARHPEREFITSRYLKHQRWLADDALARLDEAHLPAAEAVVDEAGAESALEQAPLTPLNEQRIAEIRSALGEVGAESVVDLGCGEGRLLAALLKEGGLTRLAGMDVSPRALAAAERRLRLDRLPERQRERVELLQGSLLYRDRRLAGFDAAVLSEVIEHVEPGQLPRLERVVFGEAKPGAVIVTTPNGEYNARIPALSAGGRRHPDHRFEWSRTEFEAWATAVAETHGYVVSFRGIGDADVEAGAPTQMALFQS